MNPADPLAAWLKAWPGLAGLTGLTGGAGAGSPLDALLVQAHVASSTSLLRRLTRSAR